MNAQRLLLPDGRLHLQHGPMDIIIGADGAASAVAAAHERAWQRFRNLLQELVVELPLLRAPVQEDCPLNGVVAQRMWQACFPFRDNFITPMAAVAGSVAQELLLAYQCDGVQRAWVNNGGDIALHLTPGQQVRVGLFADLAKLDRQQLLNGLQIDGQFEVTYDQPVRGLATSGWRGRSFSLGIADSVTVLAAGACEADAAATVIGNAVNLDDPRIVRKPACEIRDDSDLGSIAVTVDVPRLTPASAQQALAKGRARAQQLVQDGLIASCVMMCQGWVASTLTTSFQSLPSASTMSAVDPCVPAAEAHAIFL